MACEVCGWISDKSVSRFTVGHGDTPLSRLVVAILSVALWRCSQSATSAYAPS